MKYLLLILISIILTISCSEDDGIGKQTDGDGVIISLPYQWKKPLHENGVASNGTIRFPIYYKDNIGIPTTNGKDNRFLTLININSGETLWQWNDNYLPYSSQIKISYPYQYNNLLTYQDGGASYCINLDNGSTHWKIKRGVSFNSRLYPNTNETFFYGIPIINDNGYEEWFAFLGNIETGDISEFVRANYSGEYINPANLVGAITKILKLPNSTYLYAVVYVEPAPNWVVKPYFGLYDANTKQWVYERIPMIETPTFNSSVYWPKIHNNKFYASVGKNLVCHDLDTGEQLWIKPFAEDFLFSGFIIEEDKIIANNEDTYTYALHAISGGTVWRTETSGTSGRMSYLNGIVYFVGGSSGKLHAIDVNTGEHVWKLDGYKLDGESFKTNAVYVLPAKNGEPAKVIALTHLNAYCFEAYQ